MQRAAGILLAVTIVLCLVFILAGCTTAPLSVLPALGDKYGADKVDCHYVRDNAKYTLDCTIHDEGEIK